jgi:hypothetical protein
LSGCEENNPESKGRYLGILRTHEEDVKRHLAHLLPLPLWGGGGNVLAVSFRKPTTKIGDKDIAELVSFFREFHVQCFLGENIKKRKRKKDVNATEKGKKER